MYKKICDRLSNIQDFFASNILRILEHRVLLSFVFSGGVTFLYTKGYIVNIRDTLSQVISFSSIMLAVVSLVFTIIISVKDGNLYQTLKELFDNAIEELHKILKESILFSILVVFYSLSILSININSFVTKCIIGSIGLFLFGMMTCLCLSVFLISLTLLKKSDEG